MKKEFTFWFARRRVRSGEIDLHAMAGAYLAALAAATGKAVAGPLTDGSTIDEDGASRVRNRRGADGKPQDPPPPVKPIRFSPIPAPKSKFHAQSSPRDPDYDVDDSYQTKTWGDARHGLQAAETAGCPEIYLWRAKGLPSRRRMHGMTYLQFKHRSRAEINLEGSEEWIRLVSEAFTEALAPFDVRNDDEGTARSFLEAALSERIIAGYTPWTEPELAAAEKALAGADPARPAGMALRFFAAAGALSLGRLERADELLGELEARRGTLAFSHAMSVDYREGKPCMLRWEEDLPGQHFEVELARIALRLAHGEKAEATARLQSSPETAEAVTRAEAAALLAWLQAPPPAERVPGRTKEKPARAAKEQRP